MNKKLIIIMVAVLLLVVCISGCFDVNKQNEDEGTGQESHLDERLIGTWKGIMLISGEGIINVTYIFTVEGKCTVESDLGDVTGNWEIIDDNLAITTGGDTKTGDYQFYNNDQQLILNDSRGYTIDLIKQ